MTMIPRRALIGVLGGMGPAATVDFMAKILKATAASRDQDHVPLIVHGVPQIPDRTTAIQSHTDEPWLPMLAGVRMLERAGVDLIAVPCNTAHYWYPRLARATSVSIVHIADAVKGAFERYPRPVERVMILATRGTLEAGIYQSRLAGVVDTLVIPDEFTQSLVDRCIAAVKGGATALSVQLADEVAQRACAREADLLLLACTELPIAFAKCASWGRCIDATDALAQYCVRASLSSDFVRDYGAEPATLDA